MRRFLHHTHAICGEFQISPHQSCGDIWNFSTIVFMESWNFSTGLLGGFRFNGGQGGPVITSFASIVLDDHWSLRSLHLRWLFDPVLLFILRWSCLIFSHYKYCTKWLATFPSLEEQIFSPYKCFPKYLMISLSPSYS